MAIESLPCSQENPAQPARAHLFPEFIYGLEVGTVVALRAGRGLLQVPVSDLHLQVGVGLLQGLPLGGNVAVDLVEADDVNAPGAQARGSRGLGADELGVKGRVALVGPGE